MASQTPDETTAGSDRITFEVDRMGVDQKGQLVVTGRWFGVRGRRFVRPTLTITMGSDGTEPVARRPQAQAVGRGRRALDRSLQLRCSTRPPRSSSRSPDVAVELTGQDARGRRAAVGGAERSRPAYPDRSGTGPPVGR
jgi:hypothetical protein